MTEFEEAYKQLKKDLTPDRCKECECGHLEIGESHTWVFVCPEEVCYMDYKPGLRTPNQTAEKE